MTQNQIGERIKSSKNRDSAPEVSPAPETQHNLGLDLEVNLKRSRVSEERFLEGQDLEKVIEKGIIDSTVGREPDWLSETTFGRLGKIRLRANRSHVDSGRDPFIFQTTSAIWRRKKELRANRRDAVRERGDYTPLGDQSDRGGSVLGSWLYFSPGGSAKTARAQQRANDLRFDRWSLGPEQLYVRQTFPNGTCRRFAESDWEELVGINIRFESWFPPFGSPSRLQEMASLHVGWQAIPL